MLENQIIEEIRIHNRKVIAEVYEKYHHTFLHFACKTYKVEEQLARDVYQDTFLNFLSNIQNGKLSTLTSSLETYLFQIGKFQIFNNMRAKNKFAKSLNYDPPDETFSDEEHKEKDKKLDIVVNAIKILDEKCAGLLSDFYVKGEKYESLMSKFGFSTHDSIKSQKYKCMKKLESVVKSEFSHANLYY